MIDSREKAGKRTIPFSPPDISEGEIEAVAEVLRSGWITTGPKTKELERKLAEFCHTEKMVCLGSGTAAEELNLRILGIGEGDEVIVPAYTYTATAAAVIHTGAKAIFIDSQKDSAQMDYDAMEAAFTERTKAVVAVDIGGVIADYERIYQAADNKRDLFLAAGNTDLGQRIQKTLGRVVVLSDCAHGLGAVRNGKMAGEIADFTSFSFHAVKNLTTAEGGAATWKKIKGINQEEIYKQYQLYSLHGQSKDALNKTQAGGWDYDVLGPWYKCNMTDIMAAIGLKQLERYPQMLKRRKEIIAAYDAGCSELGIRHLVHYGRDFTSSGHLYLIRIPGITSKQRDEIILEMASHGVTANVHYKPLPMMTAYRQMGWKIEDFPNAYDYYHNLITLPLHTGLSDEDVEYVLLQLKQAVRKRIKARC